MPRLFVGTVSRNTLSSCLSLSSEFSLGIIASRRQVDCQSGYIGLNTRELKLLCNEYPLLIERDHGGPLQGDIVDDGIESLLVDCQFVNLIHIDPWKMCKTINDGIELTTRLLRICTKANETIRFEVGTEEAIFPYSPDELDEFLTSLRKELGEIFSRVEFAVIQSGTKLHGSKNIGTYDPRKMDEMLRVCKNHLLLSKEHNGDYLETELVSDKFSIGLDAINIAPEFGKIETISLLNQICPIDIDLFFSICKKCDRWKKWFDKDFNPDANKNTLMMAAGHYVFEDSDIKFMKLKYPRIDFDLRAVISQRIRELSKTLDHG